MKKIEGLHFLINNFSDQTVDTIFINDNRISEELVKLDKSKNQYWRIRCASKKNSELKLPMASIYNYNELEKFIFTKRNKYSDIQFIIHRVNDEYFFPDITGTLGVYNNEDIPKIVIELQQVTKQMLQNIDKGKRPRDWDISVCLEYDYLHKYPKVTIYKNINLDYIKYAIDKLYDIGLKIYDLYNQMGIYEASYTRFNIYNDCSIILNDHRSTESFLKK